MRVTALAVLVLLATACSGDHGPPPILAEFVPVDDRPANDEIYLLPADRELVRSAHVGDVSTTEDDAGSVVVLGRPHDEGVVDLVQVLVLPQTADREVSSSEEFEPVDILGVEARLSESPLGSGIDWYVDGFGVAVMGPTGDPQLALDVARRVEPRSSGADIVADPPDGLEILDATTTRGTEWSGISFDVLLDSGVLRGSVPVPGVSLLYQLVVGADSITWTGVRGGRGVWSSRPIPQLEEFDYPADLTDDDLTHNTLAWLERPDLLVRLSGAGPLADLLALAESLEAVVAVEFDSFEELRDYVETEKAD